MLDDNQEIETRQRRRLLVKEGWKRPVSAFAQPGGEHEGDAAEKRINRGEMENVDFRSRAEQLAVGVNIFPERRVGTEQIDGGKRQDNCRSPPQERNDGSQRSLAPETPRC